MQSTSIYAHVEMKEKKYSMNECTDDEEKKYMYADERCKKTICIVLQVAFTSQTRVRADVNHATYMCLALCLDTMTHISSVVYEAMTTRAEHLHA